MDLAKFLRSPLPHASTFGLIRIMKRNIALVSAGFLSVVSFLLGCSGKPDITYPKPYPDSLAIEFLPGLVSVDGLDFNSVFSPDGQSFYFSRSVNGQWDIFVCKYDGFSWGKPVGVSFSDETYSEADPAFSPDGKLFFISNRPRQGELKKDDFDIWYVEQAGEGRWSKPQNLLEVNSDSSEYYISFSQNGNLYFGSSRPVGFGSDDIYVSRFVEGRYTSPENLGSNINSPASEHDPCVSPDERLIVFKSENREDGFGQADLYFSTIDQTQAWMPATNFGAAINTEGYEYCPYFSPDGKYFFFSSQSDIMWIDMRVVQKLLKKV
jgi:Tol biopolymer transport system component